MARKPTDTVHLRLRFDERLRRRLEQAAERNQQSMNAEIVARLEQSFGREDMKAMVSEAVRLERKHEQLVTSIEISRIEMAHRQLLEMISKSNDPAAQQKAAREAIAELDRAEKASERARAAL